MTSSHQSHHQDGGGSDRHAGPAGGIVAAAANRAGGQEQTQPGPTADDDERRGAAQPHRCNGNQDSRRHGSGGLGCTGAKAAVLPQFDALGVEGANQGRHGCPSHQAFLALESTDRVGRNLGILRQIIDRDLQVGAGRAKLRWGHFLCLKTNFTSCNQHRLPSYCVSDPNVVRTHKKVKGKRNATDTKHFGPNPHKGKATMTTTANHLRPHPDHMAAARSLARARFAYTYARRYPWTADREMESYRFWRRSADHWLTMAAFREPAGIQRWRRDIPSLSWEAELAIMLTRCSAACAGVE